MNLIERINSLYTAVQVPEPSKYTSVSPTGEPYSTYAIAIRKLDAIEHTTGNIQFLLEGMTYSTFVALRFPCAPVKPEGTPVCYQSLVSKWHLPVAYRYLYWRVFPEIESTDDAWQIRCRALVSTTAPKG